DPRGEGLELAKAYAAATGGHRAGVLHSSFVAEVKSDLMGEQTILCGMLQVGSLLCYDKMMEKGMDSGYAAKLVQYGWETVTEALKHGGITNMMNRLTNPAKIKAFELSEEIKEILAPLFHKHMDDIMSGHFSRTMMEDWANDDANLLKWRAETGETAFENAQCTDAEISEQEYFDNGILMVAMIKAGVELAFDTMVSAGVIEESAYYESLHEVPLIANLIARKKLYEMNVVISDTAEYGCYLFSQQAVPMRKDFMAKLDTDVIGRGLDLKDTGVDNVALIQVNEATQAHSIEKVGRTLRRHMGAMKPIL
ncbi:MAG: ketol-acid reductoisomerase, partial [Desulfobacterales bacterium]|nr:ketol-acid reductoisomerase [Desulfobacterales bacterium]